MKAIELYLSREGLVIHTETFALIDFQKTIHLCNKLLFANELDLINNLFYSQFKATSTLHGMG